MSTDRSYQLSELERIFQGGLLAPVFRKNPKYPIETGVARISIHDVMDFNYVIRNDQEFSATGLFWDGRDADVLVEYQGLEDLVDDGWRLD